MKVRKETICEWVLGKMIDFVRNKASSREMITIEKHLQKCRSCRNEVKLMRLTDRISEIADQGAIEPIDLPVSLGTEMNVITLPVPTVQDVVTAIRKIDAREYLSDEEKGRTIIRTLSQFLSEMDNFLRGRRQFDTGREWMEFEKKKSDILKEFFLDQAAARYRPLFKLQSEALINQGLIFHLKDEFEKAGVFLGQALSISWALGDEMSASIAHRLLGEMEFYQGNISTAENIFREALCLAEERGMLDEKCILLRNLGNLKFISGQWKDSLQLLHKALDLSQTSNKKLPVARDLNNLSSVYFKLGQYEKAIEYATAAIEIFDRNEHIALQGQIHGNLGTFHASLRNIEDSEKHWKKAITIFKSLQANDDMIQFHRNIALSQYQTQQYQKALKHLIAAEKLCDDSSEQKCLVLLLKGRIYRLNGNVDRAVKEHQTALRIASEAGLIQLIRFTLKEYAFDYFDLGDSKSASEYLQESELKGKSTLSESDSIFKLEDTIYLGLIAVQNHEKDRGRKLLNKAKRIRRELRKKAMRYPEDIKTKEDNYWNVLIRKLESQM
ncbi:tetratricopeptide repeat protein [bacterium]|nr:tetratricopeptide repeat protein [candidate division CSSED10-310 bacterium]